MTAKIITPQLQVTGAPTNGYVLTSDASGNATWQPADRSSTPFPQRPTPGSRTYLDRREVAGGFSTGDGYAGATAGLEKVFVLSEVRGKAGIITSIWHAIAGPNSEAYERDIKIRIYLDDATTAVCDQPLDAFFGYEYHADVFANKMQGRTKRDDPGQATGAYRYMFAPFQKYMRVEFVYTDPVAHAISYWTQVGWTSLDTPYAGDKKRWGMTGTLALGQQPYTVVSAPTVTGRGQLEYMAFGWQLHDEPTYGYYVFEGNATIKVDGEPRAAWMTTGGEDFPSGAFGIAPVGGYPGGMPGVSNKENTGAFYRWFDPDPIYFNTRLDASYSLGQRGQPGGNFTLTGTADGWVRASYWLDTYATPNYKMAGTSLINQDTFAYSAGTLPSPWRNNPSGTAFQASGAGTARMSAKTESDRGSTRAAAEFLAGATSYYLEADVRIADFGSNPAEAVLTAKKLYNEGAFAEAVGVEVKRNGQYDWAVIAREDFGTVASVKIDGGVDLVNTWITLGLKIDGNAVTAYWKFADDTNPIQAFARWQTSRTGTNVGIGTWEAAAEFRNFVARPLVQS